MFHFAALVSVCATVATLIAIRRGRHVSLRHAAIGLAACLVASGGAYAMPLFASPPLPASLVVVPAICALAIYVHLVRRSPPVERESSAPRARALAVAALPIGAIALAFAFGRGSKEDIAGVGCSSASFEGSKHVAFVEAGDYRVIGPYLDAEPQQVPSGCRIEVTKRGGAKRRLDLEQPGTNYFGMGTGSGPGPGDYECSNGRVTLCASAGLLVVHERPITPWLEPSAPRAARVFDLRANDSLRATSTFANVSRFRPPFAFIALAAAGALLSILARRRRASAVAIATALATTPLVVSLVVAIV